MALWRSSISGCECKTCRSEPAREGGGLVDEDVDWAGAIASRLTPTMVLWCSTISAVYANPVGASLLAKAERQSIMMSADTASSRAGSLPQWLYGAHQYPGVNAKPVGVSLLAMAECQSILMSADTASSRASSLPQWLLALFNIRV
jgi:hypothetical protein